MSQDDRGKLLESAVTEAARVSEEVLAKVSGVEDSLKELNGRMNVMNDRLGTIDAHLENIERESAKTTHILEEEAEARKERERHEREIELKELQHRVESQKNSRQAFHRGVSAVWEVVKSPLGLLLTAFGSFIAYHYFSTGGG